LRSPSGSNAYAMFPVGFLGVHAMLVICVKRISVYCGQFVERRRAELKGVQAGEMARKLGFDGNGKLVGGNGE